MTQSKAMQNQLFNTSTPLETSVTFTMYTQTLLPDLEVGHNFTKHFPLNLLGKNCATSLLPQTMGAWAPGSTVVRGCHTPSKYLKTLVIPSLVNFKALSSICQKIQHTIC